MYGFTAESSIAKLNTCHMYILMRYREIEDVKKNRCSWIEKNARNQIGFARRLKKKPTPITVFDS